MSLVTRPQAIQVGAAPRVDLLPPEVAQRARDRSALSWAILAMVLVLGLVVAGVALAGLRNLSAQAALLAAQSQGQQIITEQQEYAEVGDLRQSISFVESAQIAVTTTEVDWAEVYAALAAGLPADATITGFGATVPQPWTPLATPSGPLRPPLVGSIAVTVSAPSIEHVVQFARAAEALDFVADISFDTIATETRVDGTVTVNLDAEALALRFAIDADGDEDEG